MTQPDDSQEAGPTPAARGPRWPKWAKINLPNQLTLLRVALVPFFIVLFLSDNLAAQWASLVVFLAASITDYFDGAIARKRGLVTNFGKIMDPLADKLLMTTALVCLVQVGMVPGWMVVVILWRELAVTGLRTLAATHRMVMQASIWGKIKTVAQMVAVIVCLILIVVQNTLNAVSATWLSTLQGWGRGGALAALLLDSNLLPYWLMFVAAVGSLYSGFKYFWDNWEMICKELEDA
jgi:CDP-diacylglycerol--glycerol-3-phosphate 3-phosphatidyltransferase